MRMLMRVAMAALLTLAMAALMSAAVMFIAVMFRRAKDLQVGKLDGGHQTRVGVANLG